jgi:hypothetical protein
MKLQVTLLASLFLTAIAATGCSSSNDGGGSTPGVFCSTSTGGSSLCYGYTNLNSDQQNTVSNQCTSTLQGKVVSSCPTAGLAGCCKYSAGGITTEECYYESDAGLGAFGDPATTGKQACSSLSGTWSSGI